MEIQKTYIKDYLNSKYLTNFIYPEIEELLRKSDDMIKDIEELLKKMEKQNGGRSHAK